MPQRCVLHPVLFLLYTAEVIAIAYRHSTGAHSYSDDTLRRIQRKADDLESVIHHLVTCIDEITCWMLANRMKLNMDTTHSFYWIPDWVSLGTSWSNRNANPSSLMAWIYRPHTMSLAWAWCPTTK